MNRPSDPTNLSSLEICELECREGSQLVPDDEESSGEGKGSLHFK